MIGVFVCHVLEEEERVVNIVLNEMREGGCFGGSDFW